MINPPEEFLHPREETMVPIANDFWKALIQGNVQDMSLQPESAVIDHLAPYGVENLPPAPPSTDPIVIQTAGLAKQLIKENNHCVEDFINKTVVPQLMNVDGRQYDHLMPLSFDEQQFIRDKEREENEKRLANRSN
ncbi:hypothetical protein WR25_02864 [Diploscapter pachys]|uniref:Uncharacterized protein n=1 Tax=Diploscapter pachys TaxID=2018661 RepID=A0A2A2KQ91_9BILA|nr:hypothetical protein WR25_02864 [Diploscapter pachys]